MIGYRVLGALAAAILVGSLGTLTGCSSEEKADAPLTAKQVQAASVTFTVHDADGAIVGDGAGILISPRVVLTSAHLVSGKARWSVTSADGKTKVNGIRGLSYDWMNYDLGPDGVGLAHPRKHDVAVIYLDAPIRLEAYPKVSSEKLSQNEVGARLRSNGAAFQTIPSTFTKVKTFPHAYLTDISKTEQIEPGNAVLNSRNEIVGLVTGRGMTTGKLYVARTNDVAGWLAPKAVCGGSAKKATYAPPPAKEDCEKPGQASSSGGSSGASSGGSSGASSGGSSGASSGGSSGASSGGSSGASSGSNTNASSGGSNGGSSSGDTDNPSCDDGGGICSGDCTSVPNFGGSSSGGSSSGSSSGFNGSHSSSSGSSGESSSSGGSSSGGSSSGGGGESGTFSNGSGGSYNTKPGSGPDGNPGSSDDTTTFAGPDGQIGTGDDVTITTGTGGAYNTKPGAGPDGNEGTDDDTVTSAGPDGKLGTGDDVTTTTGKGGAYPVKPGSSSGQSSSGASSSGENPGQSSSGGSSGSSGGASDEEECEGPTDNPDSCPVELDGCSGSQCGGAKAPDTNISYGACSKCGSASSEGEIVVN